jgi:predicted nucleic acid-binding protein
LTVELHDGAVTLAGNYGFSIYDSLIIAAALRAGCSFPYSKDLQHELSIEQLTIRNPLV